MSCNGRPLRSGSRPVSHRSNAETASRFLRMLRDSGWSQWSDGMIARHMGVSQPFVSSVRRSLHMTTSYRLYVNNQGRNALMSVDNIGKSASLDP